MTNRELWNIVRKHPGRVLVGVLTAHDVIHFVVTKAEVRFHLDRYGMTDAPALWRADVGADGNLYLKHLTAAELEEQEHTLIQEAPTDDRHDRR